MTEVFSPDRERAIRAQLVAHVTASRNGRTHVALRGIGLTLLGAVAGSAITAAALAPLRAQGEDSAPRMLLELFSALSTQPGFVSGGPADEPDTLDTVWAAEPPSAAVELIDAAREEGIGVVISFVPHSPDELWAAATSLVHQLTQKGIEVTGFGPNRTYDTIELRDCCTDR